MKDERGHLTGAERIAEERHRQRALGYSDAHDAEHDKGELLMAAVALTHAARYEEALRKPPPLWVMDQDFAWPWMDELPTMTGDPITTLEKAGALIAAEIDRLSADGLPSLPAPKDEETP